MLLEINHETQQAQINIHHLIGLTASHTQWHKISASYTGTRLRRLTLHLAKILSARMRKRTAAPLLSKSNHQNEQGRRRRRRQANACKQHYAHKPLILGLIKILHDAIGTVNEHARGDKSFSSPGIGRQTRACITYTSDLIEFAETERVGGNRTRERRKRARKRSA